MGHGSNEDALLNAPNDVHFKSQAGWDVRGKVICRKGRPTGGHAAIYKVHLSGNILAFYVTTARLKGKHKHILLYAGVKYGEALTAFKKQTAPVISGKSIHQKPLKKKGRL